MKRILFLIMTMCLALLLLVSCGCEHQYDNDCDNTCNLCKEERAVADHQFESNSCTDACKICNKQRVPEGHKYDSDVCTELCATCGEIKGEHTFDNVCDDTCNTCGSNRFPGHIFQEATCNTSKYCTLCNKIESSELGHKSAKGGKCERCDKNLGYYEDEENSVVYAYNSDGLFYWIDVCFKGRDLILEADITLPDEPVFDLDGDGIKGSNWEPVTLNSTVDGKGHKISNLKLSEPLHMTGFANRVNEKGAIKNLIFENAQVSSGGDIASVVAGYSYGIIENCHIINGEITADGSDVGAIAGVIAGGRIIGCTVDVKMEGSGSYAGIVCQNAGGDVIGCYAVGRMVSDTYNSAGIVANNYKGRVIGCYSFCYVVGPFDSGAVIGYSKEATIGNYYICKDGLEINGTREPSDEGTGTTRIDGEIVTLEMAVAGLNEALENEGVQYRYKLNDMSNSDTVPMILEKIS